MNRIVSLFVRVLIVNALVTLIALQLFGEQDLIVTVYLTSLIAVLIHEAVRGKI